jgi:hypothetical protein
MLAVALACAGGIVAVILVCAVPAMVFGAVNAIAKGRG